MVSKNTRSVTSYRGIAATTNLPTTTEHCKLGSLLETNGAIWGPGRCGGGGNKQREWPKELVNGIACL